MITKVKMGTAPMPTVSPRCPPETGTAMVSAPMKAATQFSGVPSEMDHSNAYYMYLYNDHDYGALDSYFKSKGYSVRCVKN